jgi:outer membrane cobalamin receptor
MPSGRLSKSLSFIALPIFLVPLIAGTAPAQETGDQSQPQKQEEKQPRITEEILVVGEAPKEARVGTVSFVSPTVLDEIKPLDLSDVLRLVPASTVTFGSKDEYKVFLRGIDSSRVVLLLDGIPVYEPYYSTFDLKTVSASNLAYLQVTKGPSSVLYGPNTLGGIINVITERPTEKPRLSFNGSFGRDTTWSAGADGSLRWKRFAFAGNGEYQSSKGYSVPEHEEDGVILQPATFRTNSDYRRLNLAGKLFYYPTGNSEILVEGNLFDSRYGMAAPLFTQRPRYWRFPEWDRSSLSAGGFIGLSPNSLLRFRVFTVSYYNILEQFRDAAMADRQFRSTFDNSTWGAFALGEFDLGPRLGLKASLTAERDTARQQDDVGAPWIEFHQGTYSAAVEGRCRVIDRVWLNAGVSLDTIDKFTGPATTRLNPMVGLSYAPMDNLDFHISFAKKTRFPSMRALYSPSSGNPNLLTEDGTAWELGGTYEGPVSVTAAAFIYRLRNMIDSVQLPDMAFRQFINIGRAQINGLELAARKSFGRIAADLNYTYLDHRNVTDARPLDLVPAHSLSVELSANPLADVRIGVFGLFLGRAYWLDTSTNADLVVPSHFQLDATLIYNFRGHELFVRAANLLNSYFYTEPGFPWRGRYVEAGVRLAII